VNVPKTYRARTLAEAQAIQDQIDKNKVKVVDKVDGKIKR